VVETQPATIAEFGSPQTGPNGEPNRALLAAQAPLRLCSGPLRLCSGPLRLCSGAAQPRLRVKQRLLRVEALTGAGEKKSYVRLFGYSDTRFFLDAVSQHRRSAQALIGLGTGRSPSSSGCSPSAQALLSRAQSCSSTLSSEPIMHFLTRPSCRGPLVKFRRRFSGCPVPGT